MEEPAFFCEHQIVPISGSAHASWWSNIPFVYFIKWGRISDSHNRSQKEGMMSWKWLHGWNSTKSVPEHQDRFGVFFSLNF